MLAAQHHSTQDLRSHAIDLKRDADSKHKWTAKWARPGGPPAVKLGPNNTKRPVHGPRSRRATAGDRHRNEKEVKRAHAERKEDPLRSLIEFENPLVVYEEAFRAEFLYEEALALRHASESLEGPRDDGTEFRDHTLPSTGNQVLQVALTKAVERYEDKTLMKLINDEYEVLDTKARSPPSVIVAEDDEDFELL